MGAREHYDLMLNTSGRNIKKTAAALAEYLKGEIE